MGQTSINVREVQHRQRHPLTAAIWLNQFPSYVANSSKEEMEFAASFNHLSIGLGSHT